MLNPQIHAFLNDLVSHFGTCQDKDCIHFLGDGFQAGIARITFEGGNVRVDPIDLITVVLELGVCRVAACFPLFRDSNHSNFLMRKKILC